MVTKGNVMTYALLDCTPYIIAGVVLVCVMQWLQDRDML
jgi:hypothetical protein